MKTDNGFEANKIPILEYDSSKTAIIEPSRKYRDMQMPERCVMTFFGEVVEKYSKMSGTRVVGTSRWETRNVEFYEMEYRGQKVGFVHALVGAPVAAALMDLMIARGAQKIIACGGCGVLDSSIAVGHILIPVAAVRDEGTSYHYLPASREILIDEKGIGAIARTLNRRGVDYLKCKTWTTDAFFRETKAKAERRKKEGCLSVEMECSALASVAKFREAGFAQMLYGGDSLDGEAYDDRGWWKNLTFRERLFVLSLEACQEYD